MILSPNVEVIRDYCDKLLPYTVVVSVLSCAAPIAGGLFKKAVTQHEYEDILYTRILSILGVCNNYGFKRLVLGAWGCGCFGNDPKLISALFKKALSAYNNIFNSVEFAVLCRGTITLNFECFHETFVMGK